MTDLCSLLQAKLVRIDHLLCQALQHGYNIYSRIHDPLLVDMVTGCIHGLQHYTKPQCFLPTNTPGGTLQMCSLKWQTKTRTTLDVDISKLCISICRCIYNTHTYTIVSSSIVSLVGPSAGQAQSHLHFQPPLRLHSTSGHPLPSAPNESALCQSQDQNTQVKKHGAGRRALHVWLGFMVPWLRTQLLRLGMTGGMTGVCI